MAVKQRSPLTKFDDIAGELPRGCVPDNTNLVLIAEDALIMINSLKENNLMSNAIWRDILSLTGNYRTFYSAATVYCMLSSLSEQKNRSTLRLKAGKEPRIGFGGKGCSWVDIDIVFRAQHGSLTADCMGTISVIPDHNGKWRIWMLRTWLECFDGYGHPDILGAAPVANGPMNKGINGLRMPGMKEYGAIVIGGGQCGLSVAGRLQALGVSYILLEKHAKIGENWALRYDSLRWHTAKEYGNLPFGHTFPSEDEYMMPTRRIAAGFKSWAEKHGLNIRTNTVVESAHWDETEKQWLVTSSSLEGPISMKAKNLVLAIGTGQATPMSPSWATAEKTTISQFKGTVLHAFAGYHSAEPWAGKRGVVIGTANTGHDVAEDMANVGMDTTIVQRHPTFVFPAEWLQQAQDMHFNTETNPAEGDRESFTYPMKIMREINNRTIWPRIEAHHERFDALERAGFMLDRFGDLYDYLYVRMGGHYVDTGASERIAKGEIKVKTASVKGLTEEGLIFEDGTEVGADLIVLCTGFNHEFRHDAARIVGQEAANQMDDFWGVDAEGEVRGNAKPAGREFPRLFTQR